MVFDTQETYLLMGALEDVTAAHRKQQHYIRELTHVQLEVIRLALARNLARSRIGK